MINEHPGQGHRGGSRGLREQQRWRCRARGGVKTLPIGKPSGAGQQKGSGVRTQHKMKTLCTAGLTPEMRGRWERVGNPPKVLPAQHAGSVFTAANSLFSSTLEGLSWQHENPQVSPKGLSSSAPSQANAGTHSGRAGSPPPENSRRVHVPWSHSWYHRFQSCTRAVVPLASLGEKSYLLPGFIKNAPIT